MELFATLYCLRRVRAAISQEVCNKNQTTVDDEIFPRAVKDLIEINIKDRLGISTSNLLWKGNWLHDTSGAKKHLHGSHIDLNEL